MGLFMTAFKSASVLVQAAIGLCGIPMSYLLIKIVRFRRPVPLRDTVQARSVVYLLTDPWVGAAGGAASHQVGFCKGLIAAGCLPITLVAQPFPALESLVKEYHLILPLALSRWFPKAIAVIGSNCQF